jgi:hypothetical protein
MKIYEVIENTQDSEPTGYGEYSDIGVKEEVVKQFSTQKKAEQFISDLNNGDQMVDIYMNELYYNHYYKNNSNNYINPKGLSTYVTISTPRFCIRITEIE